MARAPLLIVFALLVAGRASADGDAIDSKFPIDDEEPERSVPTREQAMKQPLQMGYLLMILSDRAEAAEKREDFGSAAKYYRAVAKAVPDRAVGFARACQAYERMGAREQAVGFCKQAVSKPGSKLDDYVRLVRLMLAKTGTLSQSEVADIDAVLARLQQHVAVGKDDAALVPELSCDLATRLQDATRLQSCVAALTAIAPQGKSTLVFRFALALARGDLDGAEEVVADAQAAALPPSALSSMQDRLQVERERASFWSRIRVGQPSWMLGIACLALVAGLGVWAFRSRQGTHSTAQ